MRGKLLKKILVACCYLSILAGLYAVRLHSYLLFHSIVELFSVSVAFAIFMIVWNSRRFMQNDYLLFLGIAHLFIGGFDLLHMLAYSGMGVFRGQGTDLPTQLWICARYTESLSLLVAPFFLRRRLNLNVIIAVYTSLFSILILFIFYWGIFPTCFDEQAGLTRFKEASEFIIIGILLVSLILLLKARGRFDPKVLQLIAWSIGITMVSELMFTMYAGPYEATNMIGHFLKLISFYLIYKALIEIGLRKPYNLLFRELKQSEQELQKARDELETRVRQRTAELAQSEEKFRVMAETIPDVFWMSTPGLEKMLYVSRAYEEIWGRSVESLYESPRSFIDAIDPEDEPKVVDALKNHAEGFRNLEYRIRKPDGSVRWIMDRGFPVRDEQGRIYLMTGVATDITQLKNAELTLEEKDRYLRTVVSNAPIVLFAIDARGTITISEGKGLDALGQKPGESVGTNVFERYREHPKIIENMRRALKGESFATEVEIRDGVVFDTRYSPIRDERNNICGVIGTSVDISERKRAEERIHADQEQLRALTAELLMVEERERRKIATELHDSVGQILAFLKIELGEMQRSGLSGDSVNTVHHIREQVEQAIKQTRTLTFEMSPPELYTLGLEPALEELAQRFTEGRNLQCSVECCGQSSQLTDPAKILLYRSVRELLINAAKHAQAEAVRISICWSSDDIRITVEDDGTGFDTARLESTLHNQPAGFGLFSIRERLKHIGGSLDIWSGTGKGTRVTLSVPLGCKDQGRRSTKL